MQQSELDYSWGKKKKRHLMCIQASKAICPLILKTVLLYNIIHKLKVGLPQILTKLVTYRSKSSKLNHIILYRIRW